MDVRDGFIVGIYNYCDRWCETCAFTSRCGVFADRAEMEARLDANLTAIVEAPPLPEEAPPPPPKWMQELIEEMNKAASEPLSEEEIKRLDPTLPPDHEAIEERAHSYCYRVGDWLDARQVNSRRDPADPYTVIDWFHYLIPAKTHRALHGLALDDPDDRDWPADYDGSAKVALLGIERSHAAWLAIVDRGDASVSDVAPFIADLIWLSDEVERAFPKARAFVRPGLDEPEEVAKLIALEGAP
jgi:hypothetical protein